MERADYAQSLLADGDWTQSPSDTGAQTPSRNHSASFAPTPVSAENHEVFAVYRRIVENPILHAMARRAARAVAAGRMSMADAGRRMLRALEATP